MDLSPFSKVDWSDPTKYVKLPIHESDMFSGFITLSASNVNPITFYTITDVCTIENITLVQMDDIIGILSDNQYPIDFYINKKLYLNNKGILILVRNN